MMKKWQERVAALISVVLLFSCVSTAVTGCRKSESEESTKKTKKTKATEETSDDTEPTDTEPTDTEPTDTSDPGTPPGEFEFTSYNFPVIDGSTSTKPMATAMTSIMLGMSRKEAGDMLEFHKTTMSFTFLIEGTADILICAQPADSVFEMMDEENFEYEMEPFAAEALVFVVNSSNPIESLTIEQIQKIYTGEITNWKEVGGEDKEIVAVQRNEEAGSQVMMEKLVMGDLEMMEAPKELMPDDMAGLIEVVKSYDNSAGAIGYTPYYYATKMKMADGLKILNVEGVTPAQDTIARGEYPFCTSYYVVIPKDAPADSPERIMFNWVLGPQGQELAEKEGYVAASMDPDAHDVTDVKVNWAYYEPSEVPDPIYTRVQDGPIDDFIAGSDYGRVIPFAGALKQDYGYDFADTIGFIDENGRIVCDPIYDSCMQYSKGFYIVEQDELLPGAVEESSYKTKYGVISTDGTYYSGMIFDDYIAHDEETFYMVAEKDGSVKATPIDIETGHPGTEITFNVDRSGEDPDAGAYLSDILDERYLLYLTGWYGSLSESYLYDGTTGESMDFMKDIIIGSSVGDMLVSFDSVGRYGDECTFYNTSGELALEKSYNWYEVYAEHHILMERYDGTGWDMVDNHGHIKASLENTSDNTNGSIVQMEHDGKRCVAIRDESIEVYDKDLSLVKTYKLHDAYQYDLMYGEDYYLSAFDFDVEPIVTRMVSGTTEFINLETGNSVTLDKEWYGDLYPDALLLESYNVNTFEEEWMIIDAKDFHVLAEGKGFTMVFEDAKTGEFYFEVWEDGHDEQLQVVSMSTGEVVWQDLPNPREGGLWVKDIYDGKLIYETYDSMVQYSPTYTTSTMMVDKDGNILFLYNTVMIPDD
ncbi:MAG: substrate-binding domain-containing protein [Clostridiales bacterium]|nr:substrate-binding domain-containing protein [Clostridiales bacterium]